jgi:hypothetical protein
MVLVSGCMATQTNTLSVGIESTGYRAVTYAPVLNDGNSSSTIVGQITITSEDCVRLTVGPAADTDDGLYGASVQVGLQINTDDLHDEKRLEVIAQALRYHGDIVMSCSVRWSIVTDMLPPVDNALHVGVWAGVRF